MVWARVSVVVVVVLAMLAAGDTMFEGYEWEGWTCDVLCVAHAGVIYVWNGD